MNITHAVKEEVVGDKLEAIFNRQKELMEKYHHIEARSGLLQTEDCPVNLDDKRGQARIKDFSWRVMEEFGEALDAKEDDEHFAEELVDGLHFLTELTILSGVSIQELIKDLNGVGDSLDIIYQNPILKRFHGLEVPFELVFVEEIAMMCNCLKNKPWQQTQMLTDKAQSTLRLKNVWRSYISVLSKVMSPDDIVEVYLKKSQVNKFRQRSNY